MFRLQLGIALPSKVLLDFVIQKWGGNLKNPQITFKNERLDEEVGSFTRRPGTGGGKPGKPCFIISDESFAVGNCGTALCTARWGLPPKPFTRSTTRKAVSSLSLTFSIRGNSPGERVGRRQHRPSLMAALVAKPSRRTASALERVKSKVKVKKVKKK